MKKWLAGIAATVIAGVLLWWITGNRPQPSPPSPGSGGGPPSASPTRDPSFLEKLAGNYDLSSWTEANRPIELAAKITEGSLRVDQDGTANWSVLLEQTSVADPGKVRMTARGKVQLDSRAPQIVGVRGSAFNNDQYLDSKWGQISQDVTLAVRGWANGGPEDRFTLALDSQAAGKQILQMTNSRGTFVWTKVN